MRCSSIFVPLLSALLLLSGVDARAQTGIARGRIVDENDQGVEGVSVSFDYQGGVERVYEAMTDKNGKYQKILVPGRYRITAAKEDYQGAFAEQQINAGPPTLLPEMRITSRESAMQAAMAPILEKFEKAAEAMAAGRIDEAQALYAQLSAENPEIPEIHYNLGTIYAQKQEWQAAETSFEKALELQPDNVAAALSLSGVYEDSERADEALAVMEKLAESHPADVRIQYSLAVLYVNTKRSEAAQAALEKVEAIDPEMGEVQYLLGTLALNESDLEGAVAHLERYLATAAADAPYRATAAELVKQLQPAPEPEPESEK